MNRSGWPPVLTLLYNGLRPGNIPQRVVNDNWCVPFIGSRVAGGTHPFGLRFGKQC
jgi:hypothetical protein